MSRLWSRLWAPLGVLLLVGCQHPYQWVDQADLSALDECLVMQRSLQARADAALEMLETIQGQTGRGPAVLDRIDVLEAELAALQNAVAPKECPEPEAPASVIAVAASSEMLFAGEKLVVGEIETVRFDNIGMDLRARIDTGAETSSLDARDIRRFQRDGQNWIRFTMIDPVTGEPRVLERPRSRRVLIIQSGADEPDPRPVVELRVTLGNNTQTAEFTLTDRSALEFPALIGRNILRDLMLVDVSKVDAAPLPPRPLVGPSGDDE